MPAPSIRRIDCSWRVGLDGLVSAIQDAIEVRTRRRRPHEITGFTWKIEVLLPVPAPDDALLPVSFAFRKSGRLFHVFLTYCKVVEEGMRAKYNVWMTP